MRVTDESELPIVRELFERTVVAQRLWVAGDASGYEEMFSPNQLTIFGPFGGAALRGKTPGAAQRVAGLFSNGVAELELVDAIVADDVICLVIVERCEADFTGIAGRRRWDLRTTQVYRRSGDEWHIVHRHAEPLLDSRSLDETLDLLEQPRP